MTYLAFLLQFLVVPIVILSALAYRDHRRKVALPVSLRFLSPCLTLTVLVVIAIIYTTPWDNYLVATGVWWYDPVLVTGITFGWVPLEEYLFFVLQTVMMTLWMMFLARRVHISTPFVARKDIRAASVLAVGILWIAAIVLLLAGWRPGKYLALELAWALPAIGFQLAIGADVLWHYRRLVVPLIVTATLYLSGMDALAIHSGTWTINPELSLRILVGGVLPVEEAVFFVLTNTLLVFGLMLGLANESFYRLPSQVMSALMNRNRQLAHEMESDNY